ncbi:MAG: hypothetical protein M3Z35_04500, partial [Nitrospirota bacterium]|nr:hypothetical protein [Nitrospirota bacterium]
VYTATQTYKWGPNGHPLQMNGETLHWDGNQLLYTSNASGIVDNVKAGKLADINPSTSKMIVLDRDPSGVVVSTHNSEGFSGWNPPDAYGQRCPAGPPPSSSAYASAYLTTSFAKISEPAIDGITDGNNVIQGGHAYDAKAGQWTTPDKFAGRNSNLLTQKPYVWNSNNALQFNDPTGNDPNGNPDVTVQEHGVYIGTVDGIHTYIQVGPSSNATVFEYGPGNGLFGSLQAGGYTNLTPQPIYGDNIQNQYVLQIPIWNGVTMSPVTLNVTGLMNTFQYVTPPNGMTDAQFEQVVTLNGDALNSYLNSNYLQYNPSAPLGGDGYNSNGPPAYILNQSGVDASAYDNGTQGYNYFPDVFSSSNANYTGNTGNLGSEGDAALAGSSY